MHETPPASPDFWVKLWGVRGSIACPGAQTVRYGGNTSCAEVMCGSERLIFDLGTGVRALGYALQEQGVQQGKIFLSHTHMDHISGFPFFKPLFLPESRFDIYAGHLVGQGLNLRNVLCGLMEPTVFPIGLDALRADVTCHDFEAGAVLHPLPDVKLTTGPLNHPGRATGYRVEFAGHVICYITDVEHVEGTLDPTVMALINNADIVIYDTMYTDDEFSRFRGWGHSTWHQGVRLCREAGARRLVGFHHAPFRDDDQLDALACELDKAHPGSIMGREGMVIRP